MGVVDQLKDQYLKLEQLPNQNLPEDLQAGFLSLVF